MTSKTGNDIGKAVCNNCFSDIFYQFGGINYQFGGINYQFGDSKLSIRYQFGFGNCLFGINSER